MFITFEGPEGSGKTTQIRRVAELLRGQGHRVVETREPGGTVLGEQLRALLLETGPVPAPETEAYLMTAARCEHVRAVIRPALDRGDVVLSDRFIDSTLAYQGAGRGICVDSLRHLQCLAVGNLIPDRTILLDLDVTEGLKRRRSDGDQNRIDAEEVSFHERVAGWYREEARRDSARWKVVDASKAVEAISDEIYQDLSRIVIQ